MFTIEELTKGVELDEIPTEHISNLNILATRMNIVQDAYGETIPTNSGYRTMEHHIRIYFNKGIRDIAKIPMGSRHLIGGAVDGGDVSGRLKKWAKEKEDFILATGLFCEAFEYTPTWVHFQIFPYRSWEPGKSIFFIP